MPLRVNSNDSFLWMRI